MAPIEPYNFRERTNLQEHNDIVNKVNEIVDVINDTDLDNINTRLTNDESQIAVNTANIKANTTSISEIRTTCTELDGIVDRIEPMVDNHETDIANLKESERRLSNDVVSTYTLYRNGEGKIKAQMETVGGTLIDSNTLDMIIPYQYDIISGTTDRSFKLKISMSDGTNYTTNDFVIPEGGGSEIVVTGITLSKDSTNVNRFHVGINLSDSTMIDSGYITMVDNVSASFVDSKLTISVNGVSSVPVAIDASGEFTAGTGITITSGTISIDDTVVALKTDIADMETKTNASATYATKTALASTDVNVALAQSTADDANTKANSCFDNVTIADNVLTFTKPDDTHVDITLPTRTIIDSAIKVTTSAMRTGTSFELKTFSSSTKGKFYSLIDGKLFDTYGTNTQAGLSGIYTYGISNINEIATEYINKLHEQAKFSDGSYSINLGGDVGSIGYYNSVKIVTSINASFTVSDAEITKVSTKVAMGEPVANYTTNNTIKMIVYSRNLP